MKVPTLLIHRPTARYYCYLPDRRRLYFGKWGGEKKPPLSIVIKHQNYVRTLLDPAFPPIPQTVAVGADITILEAAVAFIADQLKHHGKKAEETAEFSLRPVVAMFGRTPAKDFGPVRLRSVRESLVNTGRTRSGINCQVNRIKRAWRWMASFEMVPPSVVEGHRTLRAHRYGQTTAPEAKPKPSVSVDLALATASHACPIVAAMIHTQILTGLRPGEVCAMSTAQIDQADPKCWFYRPLQFKTQWMGKHRAVPLGPRAQSVLLPFLHPEDPDRPLFSPKDAVALRMVALRANRKSPVQPSQLDRSKEHPDWVPRDAYDSWSYRRAVQRINTANGLPAWSPSCLRATRAQTVFESLGLDAARTLLGHADEAVTLKFYLHQAEEKSKALALLVG